MIRRDGLYPRDAVNAFIADAERTVCSAPGAKRREVHDFEYLEAQRYQDDIANRLPQLRRGSRSLPTPTISTAVAGSDRYQESRWRTSASGGAAGLMMLTGRLRR
jgi:membrane-bound lytic murein transglycosylase MltF